MLAVVSVLRTSFVAVPAFSRVEPARTSGPVAGAMTRPRRRAPWALQATRIVAAPRRRAPDRGHRAPVLAIHEPRDRRGAEPIEVATARVRALGGEALVARPRRHGAW